MAQQRKPIPGVSTDQIKAMELLGLPLIPKFNSL